MNIVIRTIDHKDQRYETVGDWQPLMGPNLLITVSDLGNPKMNALVAIHELIEALLCKFNDPEITTEIVDSFDMSHENLDEPGESSEAPYHLQHTRATIIEKLLSDWLKIDWDEYEKRIQEL